jgi:Uma2 family endonuclease
MSASLHPKLPSPLGEPTWEVVELFPRQGQWSEADFYRLHTNRLVELVDGRLEILPMPTWLHQLMVRYFCQQLEFQLESRRGGKALFAPLPVRLFPGTIREPDVLYVLPTNTGEER